MVNAWEIKHWIGRVFKIRAASAGAITFFEVKELYNLAYEQKAQARNALRRYRRIEARAHKLDEAYRAQLELIRRVA